MTRKTDRMLFKTLAFLLCVFALASAVAGGFVTLAMALGSGSGGSEEELFENAIGSQVHSDLNCILGIYGQEQDGTVSVSDFIWYMYGGSYFEGTDASGYPGIYTGESNLRYEIFDSTGKKVAGTYNGEEAVYSTAYSGKVGYFTQGIGTEAEFEDKEVFAQEFVDEAENTEPIEAPEDGEGEIDEGLSGEDDSETVSPSEPPTGEDPIYRYVYWTQSSEAYTVVGYVLAGLPYEGDIYATIGVLLHQIYANRNPALAALICGLILTALLLVYLVSSAGRRAEEPGIHLNPLDKLPLDLYSLALGACVIGLVCLMVVIGDVVDPWRYSLRSSDFSLLYCLWAEIGLVALCAVFVLAFILTLATRLKYGNGYWWRHSIIGWCLRKLRHGVCWCGRGLRALFRMLPVIWRWLAVGFALWLMLLISGMNLRWDSEAQVIFLLAGVALGMIICYVSWAIGKLKKNTKRMAGGDFGAADTKHMHGVFKEITADLGALGEGANTAVENQMKSERLKTELITNVSHDIKTPLTSIVNYVDLLQKPHTPEEGKEYLAVLDRQSKRMKKLIEDLVEMSKASTGNIPVYLAPTNLVELANQAIAEYDEKFRRGNLIPELTVTGKNGQRMGESARVTVMADGRLLWRVLDNLLGNVVKYALPGTRVYVDIAEYERKVMLSIKNISRDRLNVSAEELMERFVRGDASRNTEGSGLGLNIAKSLMDIQHGTLNLIVDGDLFKTVLLYDVMTPEEAEEAENTAE